jgi:hypothetical protein
VAWHGPGTSGHRGRRFRQNRQLHSGRQASPLATLPASSSPRRYPMPARPFAAAWTIDGCRIVMGERLPAWDVRRRPGRGRSPLGRGQAQGGRRQRHGGREAGDRRRNAVGHQLPKQRDADAGIGRCDRLLGRRNRSLAAGSIGSDPDPGCGCGQSPLLPSCRGRGGCLCRVDHASAGLASSSGDRGDPPEGTDHPLGCWLHRRSFLLQILDQPLSGVELLGRDLAVQFPHGGSEALEDYTQRVFHAVGGQ